MEEIKKEVIEFPTNFHQDKMNVIFKESPIKEMKEELFKSDHEDKRRLVTDQQHDGLNESLTKECPIKEYLGEISLKKEEVSEEFIDADTKLLDVNELCAKSEDTPPNISTMSLEQQETIPKKVIHKESPIKEMKDELFKSDNEDERQLVTDKQHVSVEGSNELLTIEWPIQENFGEILLKKEEVSEEFIDANPKILDVNELCAKSEDALPNMSSMLLEQQDSIQKKEISPPRPLDYDPNFTGLYSRFERLSKGAENTSVCSLSHTKLNTLQTDCMTQNIYKCSSCAYQTAQKEDLSINAKSHTSENLLECTLCFYRAGTKDQLKIHSSTHCIDKPFNSEFYPNQSATKINRQTGEKPFKCSLCPYQSARKANVKIHSITHAANNHFKCDSCPYQTGTKAQLKIHWYTHTGEKPFKCDVCPYQTAKKDHLKRHSYTHTGEKPLKCSICPYQTGNKANLKNHIYSHTGEKPFKCNLCPYLTAKKDNLKKHSYIHTDKKPLKCDLCSYQTANKHNLKNHSYTHTGEKPFKCNLCPYLTAKKDNLKNHSYTHTGDKPFKCNLCTYQAGTKDQLKKHSYNHTGDKPFKCTLCPYQTVKKYHLKKHMYTHTMEKPFKCSLCAYQTVKKDRLESHLHRHATKFSFKGTPFHRR